jgi:hypothetical protein
MQSDNFLNLTTHRSEVDVWSQRRWRGSGVDDRLAVLLGSVAGLSLLAYGAYCETRRPGRGLWWIVSGAGVLGCAAACVGQRQRLTSRRARGQESPADVVTRESLDSFPASDAPSSNATTTSPQPLSTGAR